MVQTQYGRPKIFADRKVESIALPAEAVKVAHERRGNTPLSRYFGQIVCDFLGVDGIPKKEE